MNEQHRNPLDLPALQELLQQNYHKRTVHTIMSIIEHPLSAQEAQSLDHRHILQHIRDLSINKMTNQELLDWYTEEMLRLKASLALEKRQQRFLGYANTAMMNRCKRELERRGLPIPQVHPTEEQCFKD